MKRKMLLCFALVLSITAMTSCGGKADTTAADIVPETTSALTEAAAETAGSETTASETTASAETTASTAAETEEPEVLSETEAAPAEDETASVNDVAGKWYEQDALDPRTLTINEDGTFTLEYKGGGSRFGTVKIDYEVFGSGEKRAWYLLYEDGEEEPYFSFPEDMEGEQLLEIWGVTEDGELSFKRDIALRNEGYPVDLTSLTRDTDIRSLSNAEAHRFDGGEVKVDLDGDGTDEVIEFPITKTVTPFDTEEISERAFCINGKQLEPVKKGTQDDWYGDLYKVVDSYSDYFYICDIDSKDNYKEIAFVPCNATNEYETCFYRYENDTLYFIGSILYDVPDSKLEVLDEQLNGIYITDYNPMIIDGSGTITAAVRCDAPQTWFGYSRYHYDEEKGCMIAEEDVEVYPYGYDLKDDYEKVYSLLKDSFYSEGKCELRKEVELYRDHSEDSEHYTLQPQPACPTGVLDHSYDWESDDYDYWVYIIAEDGENGWIHLTEYPDYSDPLFSVLTMYD